MFQMPNLKVIVVYFNSPKVYYITWFGELWLRLHVKVEVKAEVPHQLKFHFNSEVVASSA